MDTANTLGKLDDLLEKASDVAEVRTLQTIHFKGKDYKIHALIIGNQEPSAACFGLFGGIHGIEKIGSHLCIHYLEQLIKHLRWDEATKELLKKIRVVSIPVLNPVGVEESTRCNSNGVDIMRNAPTPMAEGKHFLLSGHKYSALLPWYQGEELQRETRALIDFVKQQLFPSQFSMCLDVHSGFGLRDRLWYPYGRTKHPIKHESLALSFKKHMYEHIPYHVYRTKPQSNDYIIEGDVWDHLYDEQFKTETQNTFLPWTLELGSWVWVKKNPLQALSFKGIFNPVVDYRYYRVMRRHERLFNFYLKSVANYKSWTKNLTY